MLAFRGVLVQARPLGRPGWVRWDRKRSRGHWARERERGWARKSFRMGAPSSQSGKLFHCNLHPGDPDTYVVRYRKDVLKSQMALESILWS